MSTLFGVLIVIACGCRDSVSGGGADTPTGPRPLQPLIYTERPDLTVQAAEVRERRLMRHLLDGSNASGQWGRLKDPDQAPAPAASTAKQLGEAIFSALVKRDENLWDHLFVSAVDYAGMVHLDLEGAREFVDDVQGKSRPVWDDFALEHVAEAPEGGLGDVLEFGGFKLGQARTVDGSAPRADEPVAQYWENVLRLRLKGAEVIFELKISKILRVAHPRGHPDMPTLAVASPVEMSPQLEVYLRAGLHLKPELLQAREYPYPLAVGNFWQYHRHRPVADQQSSGASSSSVGSAAPPLAEAPESSGQPGETGPGLDATETLLEVTAVHRYGSWRTVALRRTYNDETQTHRTQHWLVLPRRIYRCDAGCRNHIRDLGWLLRYLDEHTPIYRFPLELNQGWGAGGRVGKTEAVFGSDGDWHDVDVPAGVYVNTVAIDGTGPLASLDPYYRGRRQTRYFAHGRGVVRRELRGPDGHQGFGVVESLIESRILPR